MKVMYETKAEIPPTVIAPISAWSPPYYTTHPTATELMICTAGRNKADNQAAR
jgi:hypothetical protein